MIVVLDTNVLVRDPKDVPIVAFAMGIHADLLITADRDILDVASVLPVRAISPRQFFDNQNPK